MATTKKLPGEGGAGKGTNDAQRKAAQKAANEARGEKAKAQPRERGGEFGPTGRASDGARPVGPHKSDEALAKRASMPKAKWAADGTPGPGRGKRGTRQKPRLSDAPTLAVLADRLEAIAQSAGALATNENTRAIFARHDELDAGIAHATKALRSMLVLWEGLRPHEEAPYPDARERFTQGVLFHARVARALGKARDQAKCERAARDVVRNVAGLYPALATQLEQPERIELAAAAIRAAAQSPMRIPWRVIAACWVGIEGACDPEQWRVAWHKRRREP